MDELTMSEQSESWNTAAGVSVNGRLLLHGEFDNGLPDCVADQLHAALAQAVQLNGSCVLCGEAPPVAAFDVKFRVKATENETRDADLVRPELSFWRCFAICRDCGLLIEALPRLGQFSYILTFAVVGTIVVLCAGLVAWLSGSVRPMLFGAVLSGLVAVWQSVRAARAIVHSQRLADRARPGAGLQRARLLCDTDVAFGLCRLTTGLPEGRSYKHDYTSIRPLSATPNFVFRTPSRGERISRSWQSDWRGGNG
jgi:hypothetical protein